MPADDHDSLLITTRSGTPRARLVRLAVRFMVVAADLAGYGASLRPALAPDHAPRFKRGLAAEQVQAMAGTVRMKMTECAFG